MIENMPTLYPVWAPSRASLCAACFTFISPAFTHCVKCAEHPTPDLSAVSFFAYGWIGSDLHTAMQRYKNRVDATETEQVAALVGVLMTLHAYVSHHEKCLAARVGLADGRFDLVVAAPSGTTGAHQSQLQRLVAIAPLFNGRVVRGCTATDVPGGRRRDISAERFTLAGATPDVAGKSVLIIDDVWTTGATVRSCALTLAEAGATTVGAMVVERFLRPEEWRPTQEHMDAIQQTRFDGCCTICR